MRLAALSLRVRLSLLLLAVLLPALLLTLYTALEQRHQATAQVNAEARQLADRVVHEQLNLDEGMQNLLKGVSSFVAIPNLTPQYCTGLFAAIHQLYPDFSTFTIANPAGGVLCADAAPQAPVDVSRHVAFQQALTMRTFASGDVAVGPTAADSHIEFAYPLLDPAGTVAGVFSGVVDFAWLEGAAADLHLPHGAAIVVVDRSGTVVARYPETRPARADAVPSAPGLQQLLAHRGGTAAVRGLDGVTRLFAIQTVVTGGRSDMVIGVGFPQATALAAANTTLWRNLGLLGVVGILALVVAWVTSQQLLLRPLHTLAGTAQRLAAGDFHARTGLRQQRTELGSLAAAFDQMAAELEHRAGQLAEWAAIVEYSDDAIIGHTLDGTITSWNRGAEHLYGYPADAVLGQSLTRLLPPERQAELAGFLARLAQGEVTHHVELQQVTKTGALLDVSLTLSPIRGPGGQITAASAVARDLTARKRTADAERARTVAEEANRAKSEFLSRMSHELRTPLNAILGFAQLLALDELTAEQEESVTFILNGGRHLLELINEILDISRIEAGRLALSLEPVALRDALHEAVELVRPLASKQGLSLRVSDVPAMDCWLVADQQRLKQVLLNLLSNAVKYNRPAGTVQVDARVTPAGPVRILVRDSGWGIPPEKLTRLFTPFDRLDADVAGIEGTGLGLVLARRLAEAMGGALGVDSTVGVGTTFWLDLQAATPLLAASDSELEAAVVPAGPAPQRTVLYIEDNLSNLKLVQRLLARLPGISLQTAMQGQLGLDLAREHRPDLILLDLHLPDLPGDQVLARLQAAPETQTIPVVMISADATAGQVDRLLRVGAAAYLTKPLDATHFLTVVRDALAAATPEAVHAA